MKDAKPLPSSLVQKYHQWKDTTYAKNSDLHRKLVDEGQTPPALVISCCDSRVNANAIFGAEHGEFFAHRNIANFVPPNGADGVETGTAAAVQYAVQVLKVSHIIVLGHSSCGGVKGCHDMCLGEAPALEDPSSFVGNWIEHIKPGFERVKDVAEESERLRAMEHEAVLLSLENLTTYDFVRDAVAAGNLELHALWTDIGTGETECYDVTSGKFLPI